MTERPILFSAPMVRAILDGRKTQTRRIVKVDRWCAVERISDGVDDAAAFGLHPWPVDRSQYRSGRPVPCPYGSPGDRLWVRESLKRGRMPNLILGGDTNAEAALYDADGASVLNEHGFDLAPWWKSKGGLPSIHMPRWASRLTLEVTGVRVERLQAISEEDARKEGVEMLPAIRRWKNYMPERESSGIGLTLTTARESFFSLWESINGTASLAANPWVWVVEFAALEKGKGKGR